MSMLEKLPGIRLQVFPLEKESKGNSNKKARVYLVPVLGSQHVKSFLCGHISPAAVGQSHVIDPLVL